MDLTNIVILKLYSDCSIILSSQSMNSPMCYVSWLLIVVVVCSLSCLIVSSSIEKYFFFPWESCMCPGLGRGNVLAVLSGPYWVAWFRAFLLLLLLFLCPGFPHHSKGQIWVLMSCSSDLEFCTVAQMALFLLFPLWSSGRQLTLGSCLKAGRYFSISSQGWASSFPVLGFLQGIQF